MLISKVILFQICSYFLLVELTHGNNQAFHRSKLRTQGRSGAKRVNRCMQFKNLLKQKGSPAAEAPKTSPCKLKKIKKQKCTHPALHGNYKEPVYPTRGGYSEYERPAPAAASVQSVQTLSLNLLWKLIVQKNYSHGSPKNISSSFIHSVKLPNVNDNFSSPTEPSTKSETEASSLDSTSPSSLNILPSNNKQDSATDSQTIQSLTLNLLWELILQGNDSTVSPKNISSSFIQSVKLPNVNDKLSTSTEPFTKPETEALNPLWELIFQGNDSTVSPKDISSSFIQSVKLPNVNDNLSTSTEPFTKPETEALNPFWALILQGNDFSVSPKDISSSFIQSVKLPNVNDNLSTSTEPFTKSESEALNPLWELILQGNYSTVSPKDISSSLIHSVKLPNVNDNLSTSTEPFTKSETETLNPLWELILQGNDSTVSTKDISSSLIHSVKLPNVNDGLSTSTEPFTKSESEALNPLWELILQGNDSTVSPKDISSSLIHSVKLPNVNDNLSTSTEPFTKSESETLNPLWELILQKNDSTESSKNISLSFIHSVKLPNVDDSLSTSTEPFTESERKTSSLESTSASTLSILQSNNKQDFATGSQIVQTSQIAQQLPENPDLTKPSSIVQSIRIPDLSKPLSQYKGNASSLYSAPISSSSIIHSVQFPVISNPSNFGPTPKNEFTLPFTKSEMETSSLESTSSSQLILLPSNNKQDSAAGSQTVQTSNYGQQLPERNSQTDSSKSASIVQSIRVPDINKSSMFHSVKVPVISHSLIVGAAPENESTSTTKNLESERQPLATDIVKSASSIVQSLKIPIGNDRLSPSSSTILPSVHKRSLPELQARSPLVPNEISAEILQDYV
nr:mucin-16 isoform X1 [Drosophila virilis]